MARRRQLVDRSRRPCVRPLGARRRPDDPVAARLSVKFVRLPPGGAASGRAGLADAGLPRLRAVGQAPSASLQPVRAGRHRGRRRWPRRRSGPVVLDRARHGHLGGDRAAGPRPAGAVAIRAAARGDQQWQRDPEPRQPAAGTEATPGAAGAAAGPPVQSIGVHPGVRQAVQRRSSALRTRRAMHSGHCGRTAKEIASRTC